VKGALANEMYVEEFSIAWHPLAYDTMSTKPIYMKINTDLIPSLETQAAIFTARM
jgi:hypothetical protein